MHLIPIDDEDDDLAEAWISLATIAEIQLACECDEYGGPADDGPPITFTLGGPPADPTRN